MPHALFFGFAEVRIRDLCVVPIRVTWESQPTVRKHGPPTAPVTEVGGAAAQGPPMRFVTGAARFSTSLAQTFPGGGAMTLDEAEVRIAVLEDEVGALRREAETLREEVRALASVIAERVPVPDV